MIDSRNANNRHQPHPNQETAKGIYFCRSAVRPAQKGKQVDMGYSSDTLSTSNNIPPIQTIQELTLDWFLQVWNNNYYHARGDGENKEGGQPLKLTRTDIQSFEIAPITQGVLSSVYKLTVVMRRSTSTILTEEETILWIVKFPRPELQLDWMLECEANFYRQQQEKNSSHETESFLPFDIPRFMYAGCSSSENNNNDKEKRSHQCLIIEGIPDVTCGPLTDGCPPEKVPYLIEAMAAWHAHNWVVTIDDDDSEARTYQNLCPLPGMGHRLDPLQLEHLYRQEINAFLERLVVQEDTSTRTISPRTVQFLKDLPNYKLRIIPQRLRSQACACTCIHGDYHIANWLFPNNNNNTQKMKKKPVLVDWATAGYGNPMIDLVFFLVVSTNREAMILEAKEKWLPFYYSHLQEYYHYGKKDNNSGMDKLSPLNDDALLYEWFQWAAINQLLILVAYDELCRRSVAPDDASTLAHFQRVNRRAILLVEVLFLQEWTCDGIFPLEKNHLELATEEERDQARALSDATPLRI